MRDGKDEALLRKDMLQSCLSGRWGVGENSKHTGIDPVSLNDCHSHCAGANCSPAFFTAPRRCTCA